jgi:cyclopropane-fatty-acyl-phospholipid synthase
MEFWEKYWSHRTDGQHRYNTEEFYRKEADEILYHLDGGDSLLDFGCGSAEMSVYYAPHYKSFVGVDFSPSMLAEARKRIEAYKFAHVHLLQADHENVWEKLYPKSFDRIISYGVVQYLTLDQLDVFLTGAAKTLNKNGKIMICMCIEPSLYFIRQTGLVDNHQGFFSASVNITKTLVARTLNKLMLSFGRPPLDQIGYMYKPSQINKLALKHDLTMEYVWSMYFEYRYHAILTKR